MLMLLCFLLAVASSQETTMNPSIPPMDPVRPTIPTVYLSTAGAAPHLEVILASFTEVPICPAHYPKGFTIRCEVTGAKTVSWSVMGKPYKKEFYAPYFLAGNVRENVKPFNNLQNKDRIRVACRVATRKPVWIDLIKSC